MKNILTISLACILTLLACNYRTSSKERFEKACGLKIPTGARVLRDEYHDTFQDYAIYYDVQLDTTGYNDLIGRIKNSNNFRPTHKTSDRTWVKNEKGYYFSDTANQTLDEIHIDTATLIIHYTTGDV